MFQTNSNHETLQKSNISECSSDFWCANSSEQVRAQKSPNKKKTNLVFDDFIPKHISHKCPHVTYLHSREEDFSVSLCFLGAGQHFFVCIFSVYLCPCCSSLGKGPTVSVVFSEAAFRPWCPVPRSGLNAGFKKKKREKGLLYLVWDNFVLCRFMLVLHSLYWDEKFGFCVDECCSLQDGTKLKHRLVVVT